MPNGTNGAHLHDTEPPSGCPGPFLCDGLEALAIDMGLMRQQLERIETQQATTAANVDMLVGEVRTVLQALNLGVKPT